MSKGRDRADDNFGAKFFITLIGDVVASLERHDASPIPQNRRDLVRTLFAAIDGSVWYYRDHVVGIAKDLGKLTDAQAAALHEVSYHVSRNGKISSQPRFVPLASTFRLVTRIAESLNSDLKVEFGSGDWDGFQQAIAIRNRITHPKSQADLDLSDSDMAIGLAAFHWVLGVSAQAMQGANAAFREHVDSFTEVLDALKAGDPETLALYETAKAASDE